MTDRRWNWNKSATTAAATKKQEPLFKAKTEQKTAFVPQWRTQLAADNEAEAGAGAGGPAVSSEARTVEYWVCTCWSITEADLEAGCDISVPEWVTLRASDLASVAANREFGVHTDKNGVFYIGIRRKVGATLLNNWSGARAFDVDGRGFTLSQLHLVDRRRVNDLADAAARVPGSGCLYFTAPKRRVLVRA